MSDTDSQARPRQLVVAGGVVIGASLLLVVSVFDAVGNLNSIDMRQRVQELVTSPSGARLGLTVDGTLTGFRVLLELTAVLAVAAAILGGFALQKHRGARVGLSVVAVPLLLTAPLTGNLLGALVAVAAFMLWSGQARDWFDGVPVRERARPEPAPRTVHDERTVPPYAPPAPSTAPPSTDAPTTLEPSSAPGATHGFGSSGVPAPGAPPPALAPPGSSPWTAPPAYAPQGFGVQPSQRVPSQVRIACSLTWGFSGIVALLYLFSLGALLVDRRQIVDYIVATDAWRQAGLDSGVLLPMLWVGTLLFLAWSVAAMVLAWFTWRRQNWARILLAASAGLVLLIASVAFPVGIVHQIACAFTIGALFSRPSRAWFATARSLPPGPPAGHQPPPPEKPPVW